VLISSAWAFESPEYGFSISTPSGWNRLQDSYLLAVYEAPGSEGYQPRLSMNVMDVTRVDLETVVTQIKENYALLFNDFAVTRESYEEVQGLPACIMICTWVQGKYSLKMAEAVVQNLNRYYDFGLVAAESDFDESEHLMDAALESLAFHRPWYDGEESGLTFRYPSGWALDESTLPGMAIFYGPENETFLTNVVVAVEPWNGTSEEYAEVQHQEMEEMLTGLRVLGDGTLATSIGVCRDILYQYQIPGPREIRCRAVFATVAGQAYSLVYTSLPDVYDEYLPEFNAMLGTLEVMEGLPWLLLCLMGIPLARRSLIEL
jgi:hypothetical protein